MRALNFMQSSLNLFFIFSSFNNHVDGIDEELDWLYDQLNDTEIKFDPNLFG